MDIYVALLILFGGALVAFFIDDLNRRWTGPVALAFALAAAVAFALTPEGQHLRLSILGFDLHWQQDSAARFFGWIVLGLTVLALIYSVKYMEGKARLGYFYAVFLMSAGGMLGVSVSRDLISFFVFWEIMTWTSFLLAIYNAYYGVETKGIKYIIFSSIGAYAMLTAIVMAGHYYHTYDLADLWQAGAFSFRSYWYIPASLMLGFAVKAAVVPFHVWAPDVYAKTPMSFTTVFSGAMSKMGVLGLLVVLTGLYAGGGDGMFWFRWILGWLGGITAVAGTLQAIRQNDAKYLLAYSSVAQLGYIVTALATGTRLGLMAALYLAVLHAAFKGALFMVAGAVEKQAGTTDFREISGLIKRMPWTFFVALVSVISLAGVPPLGGFVGKWLLYESLITETHSYFLVIVIFFSSTAAFLYAYRFLFGLFLGQAEEEIKQVKEASWWMLLPMLVLAAVSIVTGMYPGLIFKPAADVLAGWGLPVPDWHMSILLNRWGNQVDLVTVGSTVGVVFVLVAIYITLKGRKTTKWVSTKDISTSGEIPSPQDNLTFQRGFFKPFERAIGRLYDWDANGIWEDLGAALEAFFGFVRKIYTGNAQTYALYVIVFLVVLLIFARRIFG